MRFTFVNDWFDYDIGWFALPDPFAIFNCTLALSGESGEFNIVILGLGFAFGWGIPDKDEYSIS